MPTSNEEQKLIDEIKESGSIEAKKLNPRQQELASHLVSRGLLDSKEHDDNLSFILSNSGITRI